MGCPLQANLGGNLTFTVTTHDADNSGILTDADAVPAWRLYSPPTTLPILTGTMAKLDDDNTTGFYVATIAITPVNGFVVGKVYLVYITATVSTNEGGISHEFIVVVANMGPGADFVTVNVTVPDVGPVADADVWISIDATGQYVIAGTRQTNSNGDVLFLLDDGAVYYLWAQKDGIVSIQGQQFRASKD